MCSKENEAKWAVNAGQENIINLIRCAWTNENFEGGQWISVDAPIEQISLFTTNGYILSVR